MIVLVTSVRKNSTFSSQHGIFLISLGSFCAIKLLNGFPKRSVWFPACLCVTGLTDTPTYGNCVPKSEIFKKTGIFCYRTISFIKIDLMSELSWNKNGTVLKLQRPRNSAVAIIRYIVCKKLWVLIPLKTVSKSYVKKNIAKSNLTNGTWTCGF